MKSLRSLLALFALMLAGAIHAESISVAPVTLEPGGTVAVPINCEFTNEDITLYQFDLYLPEGVTLAKNAKGRYAAGTTYVLSDRHDEHTASLKDNTGFVRFVVSQNDAYTIAPGSGLLLTLYVQADANVTGELSCSIKNFMMFETDETKHSFSDITFTMTAPPANVPATSISLNQTAATLTSQGEALQLTATVLPENATDKTVTWTSSNTAVATVSNTGLVTAVSSGTATITATTNDGSNKSATCTVTVDIPVPATSISLSQTAATLTSQGETLQLTATVLPEDATDKSVTWTSSNTSVATVSNTGLVTAVSSGTATITATTNDGSNKSATCTVTVDIPVPATSISLSQTAATLTSQGETLQLTATVLPENATNKSVTWTSSNTSVATVSNTGLVTAVSSGTATITATTTDGSNKSATCTIIVNIPVPATSISLNQTAATLTSQGETLQLTATVLPENATDKSVTWTSSNTAVATVSNTGLVTAVSSGTATITATTNDGSNKSATCTVTVDIPVPATSISLSQTAATLTSQGETLQLTATVLPEDATDKSVTWTSSNTSVATVSNTGLVTAVSSGTATITATTTDGSNKSATCTITVNISEPEPTFISDLSELSNTKQYYIHTKNKARGTLGVANGHLASTNKGAEQYTYYCDAPSTFAILQNEGHYFLYSTADHKFITNTGSETDEGSQIDGHAVKVTKNSNGYFMFSFTVTGNVINVNSYPGIAINTWGQTSDKWDDGNQFTIEEVDDFDPTEALSVINTVVLVQSISLSTSNATLVSEGETLQLTATVLPENATDKSVVWASNNTAVAIVSNTGLVTAVSSGTATITATTTDGSNKSATCTITVNIQEPEPEPRPNVSGKTFTLNCPRGYLYGDGTKIAGTADAAQASKFAIVTYNGQTYLYDATNKAFAVHTTAAQAGLSGNNTLESRDNFSKAVTGLTWGETGYESYPFYLEDSFGNWLNMDGAKRVYMNTWKDFEGGVAGNTYAVTIVDTEFDAAEAIAMLDAYFHPTATVTYVISDENGVVFTSEPQPTKPGTVITELPEDMKRTNCSYSVTRTTMTAGTNKVNVAVSYSLPFKLSTSYADAVWYYATIRGTKYLRADEDNKDSQGRYMTSDTNERTPAYRWAFFGNPYTYFYIANAGAGEGKYLYAADAPVMQAVENPTETEAALWAVSANGNGFNLRSITGTNLYINDNSGAGNLGYWNNTYAVSDSGSRWNIEEASADGIKAVENGQWTTDNEVNIYDLSGRRVGNGRLSKGLLPKGVYIINGKKVVTK